MTAMTTTTHQWLVRIPQRVYEALRKHQDDLMATNSPVAYVEETAAAAAAPVASGDGDRGGGGGGKVNNFRFVLNAGMGDTIGLFHMLSQTLPPSQTLLFSLPNADGSPKQHQQQQQESLGATLVTGRCMLMADEPFEQWRMTLGNKRPRSSTTTTTTAGTQSPPQLANSTGSPPGGSPVSPAALSRAGDAMMITPTTTSRGMDARGGGGGGSKTREGGGANGGERQTIVSTGRDWFEEATLGEDLEVPDSPLPGTARKPPRQADPVQMALSDDDLTGTLLMLFEHQDHWTIDELLHRMAITKNRMQTLLDRVALFDRRGKERSHWKLKPQYLSRHQVARMAAAAAAAAAVATRG